MESVIILIFVIGYLSITLEHPLRLDKTVPALIMASLMWAFLAVGYTQGWFNVVDGHDHVYSFLGGDSHDMQEGFNSTLLHHLGKTAEILVFLIGAMTIVEIIDLHRGFDVL
ncbi:MAG: Na+/H+ antiporter NhaD/arsenite permease-like protein, partial [Gammaproteobacteria bacterium]